MTYKDLSRVTHSLPGTTPIWALPERLVWEDGRAELFELLDRIVPSE